MELSPDLINKRSATPLYGQVEMLLRGWIDAGLLNPGDQVPSEAELAAGLGISRMTARHALDVLVMNGQLYRRAGKGTFVAGPKQPYLGITHSFSAELGEMGYQVRSVLLDIELVQPPRRAAAELRLPPGQLAVRVRRLRFVQDEPVAIGTAYLDGCYADAVRAQDHETVPHLEVMRRATGLTVVSSNASIEAVLARYDEAELLQVPPGAPLLLMRGTALAQGAIPVYYASTVFRGDRIRVHLEEGRTKGRDRSQAVGAPTATVTPLLQK